MKRTLLALALALLCIFVFVGCDGEHEHSFTSYTSNGDATCTEDGTKTAKCDGCDEMDTKTDEGSKGHSFGEWTLSSSGGETCESKLYFRLCPSCSDIEWKQGSYEDHLWSTVTVEPTCKAQGYDEKTCSKCGAIEKVNYTDVVDHAFENYLSNNNATCIADGTKTSMCNWCDETDTVVETGSLGHSFTNYKFNGDASCTKNGTETAKCDRCDATDTREKLNSVLGHSFTNYVFNNDATCTEDGTESAKCDRCDVTDTREKVNSVLGHSFTNYVSNGDATCTEDGTKTAKCDRCDVTDTVTDEGSATGHNYSGEYMHDSEHHWQKCSVCRADGEKTNHGDDSSLCSTCNRLIYTEGLVFELKKDGNYSVAGYQSAEKDVVIPKKYKGNAVTEIDNYAFSENNGITSVFIPESITVIGGGSFFGCYNLKSVIISEGVVEINDNAFCCCSSLESISVPSSVGYIGEAAFELCDALKFNEYENGCYIGNDTNPYMVLMRVDNCDNKTFEIHRDTKFVFDTPSGDTLENIIVPDGILYFCGVWLEECPSLKCNFYQNAWYLGNERNPYVVLLGSTSDDITSAVIHKETRIICNGAFSDCNLLESITIPDSVKRIGDCAFLCCEKLASITIGSGVERIGSAAFAEAGREGWDLYIKDIDAWCQIVVPYLESSPIYRANNVYLNENVLTAITISDNVTKIGDYAFYGCKTLTDVTVGRGVTQIGAYAFYNCTALQSVALPEGLKTIYSSAFCNNRFEYINLPVGLISIGGSAFEGCSKLKSVDIPEGLTQINDSVFAFCSELQSVTIPNSVVSIGNNAFSRCVRLTDIIIPSSVKRIGAYAFSQCTRLGAATFKAQNGWVVSKTYNGTTTSVNITGSKLKDTSTAANYLTSTYSQYYWKHN
ncbi:MAG: leucine-rich repeat domain-containing protein [Clostridia bacterium]|nr:leucine-rich repeat domain-containing protein [Clostridia bacterium]